MPPVAVQEQAGPQGAHGSPAAGERLFEPGGQTLEDSILATWWELAAEGRAECPVCGGSMRGDTCADCGSELS